jgi:hypothetical protein
MAAQSEATLPADFVAQTARLLQRLEHQPAERNAELAREVAHLNEAVLESARELDFDDQPSDFLALLIMLREPGNGE